MICFVEFHCFFIAVSTIEVFFKIVSPGCGNSSVNDQPKKAYHQLPNFRLNVLFTSSILTYYIFQILHTRKNIYFVMFQDGVTAWAGPLSVKKVILESC